MPTAPDPGASHLTDAEWRVMEPLWRENPRTVRAVAEELSSDTGWAYSTVKTLLARLAEKGAVTFEVEGNARLYSPALTRRDARRAAVRALVRRAFGGATGGLVHHLVGDERLSARDRRELERMLREEEPGARARKRARGARGTRDRQRGPRDAR